jgi:trk system potassium uptake protein TrkH
VTRRPVPSATVAPRLEAAGARRQSYARLAVSDGVGITGIVTVLCGVAGVFDDVGDAIFLIISGGAAAGIGIANRRTLQRSHRPAPGRVLSGLAALWLVLVVLGTGIYLATGTVARVDNAFVEAAAGFSTTSLTTLNPEELTVPMQLWRAATQWIGGLIGIMVGVIALPLALRGPLLVSGAGQHTAERLAPTPVIGRQRVLKIYSALTLLLGISYAAVGLGTLDSTVHALTTISTGGFSSHTDSFVGFGSGARAVATVGMIIAGSSYFIGWWVVRGRLEPVWRSTELRLYAGLLAVTTLLITLGGNGVGVGDAIFTSTSALSTTGFAVLDWTLLDDSVLMVLLIVIATGSMSGSAGGGLRVVRAWTLVGFASRELRRQLDSQAVVVIKQGGHAVNERALERTTGYQIAHLGLCGLAAFLLGAAGVDLEGAIYTGISVLSTHGPGLGVGPFGSLEEFSPAARLFLVPFMLAGRMTILPLLLGVAWLFRAEKDLERRARRLTRMMRQ